jgi:hypothetical protein
MTTLCDRCLAIGAVSGYKNVCENTCKGGRSQKQKIEDAESGDN